MPINFACSCGQPLFVADQHAGMAVQCPACGQTPTAPSHTATSAPRIPAARAWNRGAEPAPSNDPNAVFGYADAGDAARERYRQAQEREQPSEKSQSFEGGIMNSGVAGGALAMIAAVVWFVVGWMGGVIFFYPPILFIIGLVSFFKGLAAGPQRR